MSLPVIKIVYNTQAELLGSRLKGGISSTEIMKYVSLATAEIKSKSFSLKNMIWYFVPTYALLQRLYDTSAIQQWCWFLDFSKVSLKVAFLHNGNKFPSVPITHAANIKESYENSKLGLENIQYENIIETFVGI
jgi:hypothetical protein